jgi:capsular exopolysaccharide synthesis family protein
MIDKTNGFSRVPTVISAQPLDLGQVQEAAPRDLDPRRLLASLWRRRKLLFSIWALFAIGVMVFTLVQPKKYTVAAKLIAGGNSASEQAANTDPNGTNLPILNALLAATGQQSSEQIAELMTQEPVSAEVIRQLGLKTTVDELTSHLFVRPVTDTAIITLQLTWSDPATAAKIANTYANVFVEHERQLVAGQADTAIGYLQKELPLAESRMRAQQEALTAYQESTGIADLPTQTTNELNSAQNLETRLQQSEVDEQTASASLAQVQAQLASTPENIVNGKTDSGNPVAATLAAQISTLTMQLAAARKQYTDDYPTVIQLKSQLAEAKRELKDQPATVTSAVSNGPNPVYQSLLQTETTLSAQVAAAQASIAKLRAQRAEQQPQLASLPAVARRITDLQRSAKAATDVYQALQTRYQDALIARTTALSDVSITQAASPDVYSVSPNVPLNLLLGVVVGLILAVTGVFLADFFDDRFRSEDDVKERLGIPVLATIPLIDGLEAKDSDWVKPLAVESFYQLVASLRYSSHHPPRTISFTSADQSDGKSTIAMNTAISMGQMKARVLIVDADLRRPSMHTKLKVANDVGLSDVLVGVAALDDAIRPTEHAGVSILSSGRPAPNPVGLLQSEAFDRLLKAARERFDFVIVDAPALRSIVDGIVLGVKTEGTVLVVSSTSSEGRAVRAAVEKLRSVGGINLVGVVLNRIRPDRRAVNDYYLGAGQTVSLPPGSSV